MPDLSGLIYIALMIAVGTLASNLLCSMYLSHLTNRKRLFWSAYLTPILFGTVLSLFVIRDAPEGGVLATIVIPVMAIITLFAVLGTVIGLPLTLLIRKYLLSNK